MSFVVHRAAGSRTVRSAVERGNLRIGRGAGADLRFEDAAVDLEHARIDRLEPAGSTAGARPSYRLVDLGSVTGTYLEGERVDSAVLTDGAEIGVGGWLLRAELPEGDGPLVLRVRPADAEPRPGAAAPEAPRVDYGARYGLRRGPVSKPVLGLAGGLLALAAVLLLPATGRLEPFRPGELTSWHAGVVEAAACGDCHAPFRGASAIRCGTCHGPGTANEALPHVDAVRATSLALSTEAGRCTACHLEHLGADGLQRVREERCLECHRDLDRVFGSRVLDPPPGEAAAAVRTVTGFAADHPELTVVLPGGAGEERARLPVTSPEVRRADPTAVLLDHAVHLAPGLLGPPGGPTARVQLVCGDCHEPAPSGGSSTPAGSTGLRPIEYEAHCADCHALTFDDRFPDEVAPHAAPEELRGALYSLYQDRAMRGATVRERRLRALRSPGERDFDPRLRQEAIAAEARLVQKCALCHRIDLEATPFPEVEPPGIPTARWLPAADFDHGDHRLEGLTCEHCHAGKRRSEESADLLLPGIAACTPCHGGGEEARNAAPFPVVRAPAGCRDCHRYHAGGGPRPGADVAAAPADAPLRGAP